MHARDALVLGALFVLSAGTVYGLSGDSGPSGIGLDAQALEPPPGGGLVQETEGTLSILFLGDTHPGDNFRNGLPDDILSHREAGYAFGNFRTLLEDAGVVLLDLESPTIAPPPEAQRRREQQYWTDVTRTPELLRGLGVSAVSLANDHVLDFGVEGLEQTLDTLGGIGIAVLGAGADEERATRPFRVERAVGGQTFHMAVLAATMNRPRRHRGGQEGPQVRRLDPAQMAAQIAELKAADPELFVVAYPHWGQSYRWASKGQRDTAHQLIDAGADLIVGHGSHMLQEIEQYKKRWILYGLGNFVFTSAGQYGRRRGAVPYGLVARLQVREADGRLAKTLRVYPIHTDNLANEFAGRFAGAKDLGEVHWNLIWKAHRYDSKLKRHLVVRVDRFGHHFELPLHSAPKGRAKTP